MIANINNILGYTYDNGDSFLDFYDTVESFSGSIFTEEGFLNLLDQKNYNSNKLIGAKVKLSNSVAYNNGEYLIIDVNHDGASNTYDIWSVDCVTSSSFDTSGSHQDYQTCYARSWLVNTYFNGFSERFKSHCQLINYSATGSSNHYDYIVLPSLTNLNMSYGYSPSENNPYSYLNNNSIRSKNNHYWTRTYETELNRDIMYIASDGTGPYKNQTYNSYGLAPIIRVH